MSALVCVTSREKEGAQREIDDMSQTEKEREVQSRRSLIEKEREGFR